MAFILGGTELVQITFQSPSRGGHLRGFGFGEVVMSMITCFSPLHEGDTSVAWNRRTDPRSPNSFQSPSRGGHLRGPKTAQRQLWGVSFQSPSRGGHLRGANCTTGTQRLTWFQSPSRGGHLRGGDGLGHSHAQHLFQSPSRGGHLRGWLEEGEQRELPEFQSPSRGGHLRGPGAFSGHTRDSIGFSPLHEGDTSVANPRFSRRVVFFRFSPLHEGDTSVAALSCG